jgi:hypothetical protein
MKKKKNETIDDILACYDSFALTTRRSGDVTVNDIMQKYGVKRTAARAMLDDMAVRLGGAVITVRLNGRRGLVYRRKG